MVQYIMDDLCLTLTNAFPLSAAIDGYLEHTEDVYNNTYFFKQEETRVLYPFKKLKQGNIPDYPQYCYQLFSKNN